MPGLASKKKELYLGNCLKDLHDRCEIPQINSNVQIMIRSLSKLFKDAEDADALGDEEKAYVLYMKYFNVLQQVKTKADYKKQKEYYDNLIGRKNQVKAIDRAEILSKSLKERYELKEAEAVAKKFEDLEAKNASIKSAVRDDSKKPAAKEIKFEKVEDIAEKQPPESVVPAVPSGSITCQNLCELLRDTNTKVILMDVRPEADFKQSHISHTDCISVPQESLSPGSTVNHIQTKLSDESKAVWMQRQHADHIILMDWKSTLVNVEIGTPLRTLKDALYKFDLVTVIKSEPLVLEGGYEQWLLFYPTMTTNAHVARPSDSNQIQPPSPTMTLDFDYPDLDENLQEKPAAANPDLGQPSPINHSGTSEEKRGVGIPQIDRSLKPSRSYENQSASSSSSASSLSNIPADSIPSSTLNNTSNSSSIGSLYPDVSASSQTSRYTSGKNINILNDQLANGPKNISLSVKNDLATDLTNSVVRREEKEAELQDFQRLRDDALKQHQFRLEETEKKLRDLNLIKKKEEKDVADLMRMKKKLKEGLDEEKARLAAEEEKRLAAVRKARIEEEEKKCRLEEVEKLRQERKKDEQDKEQLAKQKEEQAKRQEEQRLEQIRLAERELKLKKIREEEQRELERKQEDDKRREAAEKEAVQEQQEQERQKREEEAARMKIEREEAQKREEEKRRIELEAERKGREERKQENRKKEEQERRRREELERKKQEELAKEKVRKEQELAERERQMKASEQAPSKTVPSTTLPPGWEKRLDRATNRYFYVNHNNGTTQWIPPATPTSARQPEPSSYTTKLKDEPVISSSRGLSRSHSSPNIKKQLEEEEEKARRPIVPNVDRGNKPNFAKNIPKQPAYAVRKRDLNPVFGNVGPAQTGLRNLGNTCYMNSTIQCLNNCSPLVIFFLNDHYIPCVNRESSEGMHGEMVDEFAVVIKALWSQQYRSITPRDLKHTVGKYNPMFAGYQQQDSQEFLTFLLDGLHEGLNEVKRAPDIQEQNNENIPDIRAAQLAWEHHKLLHKSIIVELFQGQLKSTLMCRTCRKKSVTFQAFMFLSLPIPASSRCSLRDCINEFLKPELMTGSSRWKCPQCRVERDSEKKIDIWKVPPILLIGLNRFYSEGMWMQKKTTYVDFPVNDMDFGLFMAGPERRHPFHLYGISNHYGTMEGGHYTAFCRNPVRKRWYKFDDQDVYEMSESDVKTSAAFVLYYSSIELKPPVYKPHL